MQISRHWRMNSLRYRLQGIRYQDGNVSLEARPSNENPTITRESSMVSADAHEQKKVATEAA